MAIELSEQEQLRRQSLTALRNLGIEPYPAARYEVTATAREIADNYDDAKKNFQDVRIAGRIMSRRIMGSASFFELQDHTGRIQVYIRRDDICPEGDPTLYNTVFKKLLDIGDFIGVEGFAFHTNTGELSVHCRKFTVLSKRLEDGTKIGYRKLNQSPYLVHSFRLFDKVRCLGQIGFIFGRRSSGYFDVRRLDGVKLSSGISYRKLTLLEKRSTYLTELRKEDGASSPV